MPCWPGSAAATVTWPCSRPWAWSASQLLRVVCWEATALAAASLLVGAAARGAGRTLGLDRSSPGRPGWRAQADVPVPLVLLAIPATLLLANLIAVGPGWTAARIPAATVLRSE